MSGVSLSSDLVHGVWSHRQSDHALRPMYQQYHGLLLSSYGPKGTAVLIQNAVGRETYTSSSSMITSQLQFFHPSLKFINALIDAQIKNYNLYGAYVGIICSGVLMRSIDVEHHVPRRIVSDVAEWVMEKVLDHLHLTPDHLVFHIDISNLESILSFINTILFSKPTYSLNKEDKEHLSICVAMAFIKTIPKEENSKGFGKVLLKTSNLSTAKESKVFDGVIYPEPQFYSPELMKKLIETPSESCRLNLILFNVPLAFETGTGDIVRWNGDGYRNANFVNSLLDKLKSSLTKRNIKLLLNQKVIDPSIKYELEKIGIMVLERLGTASTESIMRISGCEAVSNLNQLENQVAEAVLGKLSHIQLLDHDEKEYLLLANTESNDVTLLLPGTDPHLEAYLKETIESCFTALRLLVQDPRVVAGGGCFETYIASYIKSIIPENIKEIEELVDTSSDNICNVAKVFVDIFISIASQLCNRCSTLEEKLFIDKIHHHLWNIEDCSNDDKIECDYSGVNNYTTAELPLLVKQEKMCKQENKVMKINDNQSSNFNCACGHICVTDYKMCNKIWTSLLDEIMYSRPSPQVSFHINACKQSRFGNTIHFNRLNCSLSSVQTKCDCFLAKLNAIKIAFEGTAQLLKIGHCIFDK